MGSPRDYYADLELPPTADIQDIKKQFRKLALKYHPDRNPGREQEVNSQFQIIQAAHEVLSDSQQKAKYDATLGRSSRYPAASGVRGNPWQNVSQQFPTPPRRNPPPRNPTSGAQRWHDRFSSGVPPTAKQQATADPSAKANAARAFESMRKGGAKNEARPAAPPPPPPPPPRTEAAKKRAEASFGARKTGYYPRSAVPGDEPPVTNSNYSFRSNTERQQTVPDPLSQFRQKEDDSFMDSRQSSPYTAHGGEKTNPFEKIPPGRAKSARASSHRDDQPKSGDQEYRSSSVPRSETKDEATSGQNVPRDDEEPRPTPAPPNPRPKASFKRRASAKPTSSNPPNTDQTTNRPAAGSSRSSAYQTPSKAPINGAESPSMYATPQNNEPFYSSARATNPVKMSKPAPPSTHHPAAASSTNDDHAHRVPSGIQHPYPNLTPFERQQRLLLDQLIRNRVASLMPGKEQHHATTSCQDDVTEKANADISLTNSFNLPLDDDTFTPNSPEPSRFNRSSIDGINTNFVNDDNSASWQFSAGSGETDSFPINRSQSGSRTSRRSPNKRPPLRRADSADPVAQPTQPPGAFDANGWSDKFGPQNFVPQTVSTSPTRSNRANSRKAKTAKPTVGNATVVDGSSGDEEAYDWRGRKHQKDATVGSPQAMDIDPPQAAPAETSPRRQRSTVRNIPVEPSRPEWRSGNVDGVNSEPEAGQEKNGIPANNKGSEDSEEFRATLADLKNVAPFAEQKSGLKSFAELRDNLPFASRASGELPIKLPQAHPLVFPTPPAAPRLPPTVAIDGIKPTFASWSKYLEEFESYLRHWDSFNSQVVDHFATRNSNISHARTSKGYTFLGARGDGDVVEYYNWVQQDNDVRRRWQAACDEHEQRFQEFMAFRERMTPR